MFFKINPSYIAGLKASSLFLFNAVIVCAMEPIETDPLATPNKIFLGTPDQSIQEPSPGSNDSAAKPERRTSTPPPYDISEELLPTQTTQTTKESTSPISPERMEELSNFVRTISFSKYEILHNIAKEEKEFLESELRKLGHICDGFTNILSFTPMPLNPNSNIFRVTRIAIHANYLSKR